MVKVTASSPGGRDVPKIVILLSISIFLVQFLIRLSIVGKRNRMSLASNAAAVASQDIIAQVSQVAMTSATSHHFGEQFLKNVQKFLINPPFLPKRNRNNNNEGAKPNSGGKDIILLSMKQRTQLLEHTEKLMDNVAQALSDNKIWKKVNQQDGVSVWKTEGRSSDYILEQFYYGIITFTTYYDDYVISHTMHTPSINLKKILIHKH